MTIFSRGCKILKYSDTLDVHIGPDCDLSGLRFKGIDLNYMDLSGTNLYGTHLTDCDLEGTNLSRCYFSRSKLVNCSLSGAIIDGVTFDNVSLTQVNLSGMKFNGIIFSNMHFTEADLQGCVFKGVTFDNVVFDRCNISGAVIEESMIPLDKRVHRSNTERVFDAFGRPIEGRSDPERYNIRFTGSNLSNVKIKYSVLRICDFGEVNFEGVHIYRSDLDYSNFSRAIFKNSKITDDDIGRCNTYRDQLSGIEGLKLDLDESRNERRRFWI